MKRALFILVLSMALVSCSAEPEVDGLERLVKKAGQGDAQAQYKLGEMYDKGEGVVKDNTEAVKWYRKAAEQGHPNAQWQLGYKYEYGSGVSVDNIESVKWFRKAAEQGHTIAQLELSMRYATGKGVIEDSVEAYKWALLAQMNGMDVTAYKGTLEKEMTPEQIAEAQKLAKAYAAEMEKK
jgi:TPR repeat protein